MASAHGDDAMRRAKMARRIGVLGVVLICLLLTVSAASAQTFAVRKAPVTAVDARTGRALPANPLLQHGSRVILTVPGFAARTQVVVALVGVRHLPTVRANGRGVVVYRYTVPDWMLRGGHSLIFSGPAPAAVYRRGLPTKAAHQRPRRDPQTVMVAMPYDPIWRFRVGPRAQVGGTGAHHPGGNGHGPPSVTGVDIAALIGLALLALAAGIALLVAGVRRRRTAAREH